MPLNEKVNKYAAGRRQNKVARPGVTRHCSLKGRRLLLGSCDKLPSKTNPPRSTQALSQSTFAFARKSYEISAIADRSLSSRLANFARALRSESSCLTS